MSKNQRRNRAERRELWRDELSALGLKEMTLGVWRDVKNGIDFYPSKLKAYKFIKKEFVDWELALKLVKGVDE